MRYDLVVIGETPIARDEAVAAARRNRFVALIRTRPLCETLFDEPLSTWDFARGGNWPALREQFAARREQVSALYAREGIDEFAGDVRFETPRHLRLTSRDGIERSLEADDILIACGRRVAIPLWMRAELPGVVALDQLPALRELPQRILLHGDSLAAWRASVMLARLNRRVAIVSPGDSEPDPFDGELKDLRDEALRRGVAIHESNQEQVWPTPFGPRIALGAIGGPCEEFDLCVYAGDARGNLEGSGLVELGVCLDDHGAVWCNATGRTDLPTIRAAGAICSPIPAQPPQIDESTSRMWPRERSAFAAPSTDRYAQAARHS